MSDVQHITMAKRPEVAVLGSARLSAGEVWWTHAHRLGELLATAEYAVVTGGYGGLMAAVSRGAHEAGGRVIGLPMQHWTGLEPNVWNADLRWSSNYAARLNHLLHCDAAIALPGGIGTLSELTVIWAAMQTEARALPLVLLGDCWPPLIASIREQLVVHADDLNLLRFAASPEAALREIQAALQNRGRLGPGPQG